MPPRALLLDFQGTLARLRRPWATIYVQVARDHGIDADPGRMQDQLEEAMAELPREIDGAYRFSDAWFGSFVAHVLREGFGVREDVTAITRDLIDAFGDAQNYCVFPDARDLLLRAQDRPVGVVSNWGSHLSALLEGLGLDVDVVLSSACERLEKPDPDLFSRALHRLGVAASHAVHIGDRIDTDVRGAEAAGIDAVWVDRSGTIPPPPRVQRVHSLREIELS